MDKFKRSILAYENQLFLSLITVFGIFGVYIGYITADQYKTIVDAVLGFTVLYLLQQRILSPSKNVNQLGEIKFEFSKDLKYLIYAFVLGIIMFWAGVQVIHLIWYLKNTFT